MLGALIAQRVNGRRAGLCAGIVLAVYPPLIANDVTVLVESCALLLCFACVLLLLDGRTVRARCELDDGWAQAEVDLPALVTCAVLWHGPAAAATG